MMNDRYFKSRIEFNCSWVQYCKSNFLK